MGQHRLSQSACWIQHHATETIHSWQQISTSLMCSGAQRTAGLVIPVIKNDWNKVPFLIVYFNTTERGHDRNRTFNPMV